MTLLAIWNITLTDYEKGLYGATGGYNFRPHYNLAKYFWNNETNTTQTELAFNELAISVINAIYANKPILNTLNAKTKDDKDQIILKDYTIENIRKAIKKEISVRNLNGTFYEMTKQQEINTPNFSQSTSRTTWFTTKSQLSDETWNFLQNSLIDKYELDVATKRVHFVGMDGVVEGHNIEKVITHEILYDKLKDHFFGIGGINVSLKDNNDPSKGLQIIYEPAEDHELSNFIQSSLKEKRIDLEEVLKPNLQDGINLKYDPINKNYIIGHNFNDNLLLRAELNRIIALIPTSIDAYTKSEINAKITPIKHNIEDIMKLFPNNIVVNSDMTSLGIEDREFSAYGGFNDERRILLKAFNNMIIKKIQNFYLEVKLNNYSNLSIYFKMMLEDINSRYRAKNLTSNGELRMHFLAFNGNSHQYYLYLTYKIDKNTDWIDPVWLETYINGDWDISRVGYFTSYLNFFDRRLAIDSEDAYHKDGNFKTMEEKFNEPLNGETTEIVDIAGNTKKLHDWFIEEYIWHDIREEYKVNGTVLVVSSKNNASAINRPAGEANKWLGAIGLDNKEVDTTAEGDGGIQWNTNEATLSTGYYEVEYLDIIYDDRVIGLKGVKIDIVKPDGTPAVLGVDYKVGFKYRGRHYTWTSMQTSETREFFCGGKVLALKPIKLQFKIRFASNTERGSGTGHNQLEVKLERQKWVVIVKKGTGTEPENVGNAS